MQAVSLTPLVLLPVLLALLVHDAKAQTLRGSRASVERIHRQAQNHGLHFYESSSGVRKAVTEGRLVRLQGNRDYRVEGATYPYALPAAEVFVRLLGRQYRAACGERLVVTSATRPRSFRLVNSVDKSVHPTGMAVDPRKPARTRCLEWLRRTLLSLERAGVLEAVEERNPPHFHVAVFPRPYTQYVQRQGGEVPAIAAARPGARAVSTSAGGSRYQVRRGDSLWAIARRHGRSVEEIKRANGIRSSRIEVGQVLVIPGR